MTHVDVRQRRGAALFVVTIVVVLVTLSAYGFVVLMQAENRASRIAADRGQVQMVHDSGYEFLRSYAAMSRVERELWAQVGTDESLFRDVIVDQDYSGTRHGRFSIVHHPVTLNDVEASPGLAQRNVARRFDFGVVPTAAKLSLPTLLEWDQAQPGYGRVVLMQLPGMTEHVADSILDWLDEDEEPREFGAELEFYERLNPPRKPANQLPKHLDELLSVRGVQFSDLYGDPVTGMRRVHHQNHNQQARGAPDRNRTGGGRRPTDPVGPQLPWSAYLTVYSAERNESRDGNPRINLNQEDLSALTEQLNARFEPPVAKFVVALRQYGPYDGGVSSARPASELPEISSSAEAEFTIEHHLQLIDVSVGIPMGEEVRVFESPLRSEGTSGSDLVDFCDATTCAEDDVIQGRINIHLAPREVLTVIPGFSSDSMEQLIALRQNTTIESGRQHAIWLLVEGVVDRVGMQEVWPWITTCGDVMEGEVVAYYDQDSPWLRTEFVLDATREELPLLFRRNMDRLGRGYRYDELSLPLDEQQVPGVAGQSMNTVSTGNRTIRGQ